ncbi:MAG: histidinol-phosphate aminotransferase family protein [Methanolinea sp.]|nr:histidinol-phosphate aminotransferase family protein [Methanolinea sp.]
MNGQHLSKVVHGGTGIRVRRETGAPLLDFSASINPYPPHLTPTLDPDRLLHYPDDSYLDLKEVMSGLFCRDTDEICVGNGSIEIIRVLCSSILSPGDRVGISPPTFGEYELSARLVGASLGEGPGTRIRFLCNPNNPTGHLMKRSEVVLLLEQCAEDGCLLVVDEAFIEISDDPSQTLAGIRHPFLFVMRSLTKSFAMPGIRFGYGFGEPGLVERLEVRRLPWSVNVVAEQMAMEAFMRYGELARSRARIREERERLSADLEVLPLEVVPSSTNFLLLNLARDVGPLCADLLRRGVLVRDCHSFGLPSSIRVAVRTREENLRLVEALSECMH